MSASSAAPPRASWAATAAGRLRRLWRSRGPGAWLLLPLAGVYALLAGLQRALYRHGWKTARHPGVPTVVVGNVIAGGAGKTPVTLATVRHLIAQGWQPGIISRGYGRAGESAADGGAARQVHPEVDTPLDVGDEPLLLARAAGVPVFVARCRSDAARALLAHAPHVNVLVCDDGLQHHALARDVNVCVFNDDGIGNGWLLPAGPLREPWPRRAGLGIAAVHAVLHAGSHPPPGTPAALPCFRMRRKLASEARTRQGWGVPLSSLRERPVHAVAAIARPEDFFAMLCARGLTLVGTQALPDHDDFAHWQRPAAPDLVVVCTEKDAAKLWPHAPDALAVPLELELEPGYFALLDRMLAQSPSEAALQGRLQERR